MAWCSILVLFCLTVFSQSIFGQVKINNEDCDKFKEICEKQTNCKDCIQTHECCHFCYEEYANGTITSKCQTDIASCKTSIPNKKSNETRKKNDEFSDVNENNKAVQIKPQEVNINLHHNRPYNFSFTYKPAKNYLLDLYYMTDVTSSMRESIQDMSKLGNELSSTLNSLTSRYRIAFGTYMDKTEMPFYPTDKEHKENPCSLFADKCAEGIFFKHALNFTNNIAQFIKQVNMSKTSANLDDMEGGFDALMQVLLCNETINWDQSSRKIILFVTGSVMHFAGDGLLAGAVRRNRKQCFVDANGEYTAPQNLFDYPSLEEVYREMVEKKVNLIIASKSSSYEYYDHLRNVTSSNTYLGQLDNTAEVAKHIKDGYHKFTEEVAFSPAFGNSSDIQINFFSKCNGKRMMKTSKCNGIKVGQEIEFIAELLLSSKNPKNKYELRIEEKNIAEYIKIDIDVIESKCKNCNVTKLECKNGQWDCCECICDNEWSGRHCNEKCSTGVDTCRYKKNGILQPTCSGPDRGDCVCGKCKCSVSSDGQFCEHVCPIDPVSHRVCGGPNNGKCLNETCICQPNFTGAFCTCSTLETNCNIATIGKCNGHGTCKCNKCECDAGFSGDFCEICDACAHLCDVYDTCIGKHFTSDSVKDCQIEQAFIPIENVNEFSESIHNYTCHHRFTNKDNNICDVQYGYELSREETIKLQVLPPTCSIPMSRASLAIRYFGGVLIGGVIFIVAWICRNRYLDRVEYARFIEQEKFKIEGNNPLYKEVCTHYRVPDSVKFAD